MRRIIVVVVLEEYKSIASILRLACKLPAEFLSNN